MITIFSNPRSFIGPFDIIQRNAIKSWIKLGSECEIILFEDEEKTTSKIAEEFGLKCITDAKTDEFGTALLDDVFKRTKEESNSDTIVQVNTDIILMSDFLKGINLAKDKMVGKPFFMSGRRWNLDVTENINYEDGNWEEKIKAKVKESGKLHKLSGMDYWIFSGDISFNPLPFVIGRPGMDSWLVYKFRSMKIPVIDSTDQITIIHQNHNYPSKKKPFFKIEKENNLKLAGGFKNMMTLRDANWVLTSEGIEKPKFPRRIFSELSLFIPWRFLLLIKRKLQKIL